MTATTSASKSLNSDNITVLAGFLDYRTPAGARDYNAIAVALTIFNYYIASKGYAQLEIDTIARVTGLSRKTAVKYIQAVSQHIDKSSGHIGQSNRYALTPLSIAQIDEAWNTGNKGVPNTIDGEEGVVVRAASRPRQVFERFDDDVPTDWFVSGSLVYIDAFKQPGLSPAARLAMTGIRHNLDLAFIVSQLAYPTVEARGFSFDIARLLSLSTGYASVASVVFSDALGMNDKQLARLNKALIASGLWRIDTDRRSNQLVYTPTPFLLAQVAAYYNRRRIQDTEGHYSGERLDYITKNHPHIEQLVATHAMELGINDQIGTADMTAENSTAPTPGTVWKPLADQPRPAPVQLAPEAAPAAAIEVVKVISPSPTPGINASCPSSRPVLHLTGPDATTELPEATFELYEPDSTHELALC